MTEERPIKELLQLMLEHQDFFTRGLCSWASDLVWYKLITIEENRLLHNYIKQNRPKNFYWLMGDEYYWKFNNIKPRVKWLKKHIARL